MEQKRGRLGVKAFADLCGTTKETLRHYREIGLLRPAGRGENGYFYYEVEQFYDYYAIAIFRQTGTPLEEIQRCLQRQDSEGTLAQLRSQRRRLEEERRKLAQMDFILSSTIENLELGTAPDLQPRRAYFEAEHLLTLPAAELEGEMTGLTGEDEMLILILGRCQQLCRQYGLQTNYQLGAIHRAGGMGEIQYLYTRLREAAADCPYYRKKPAGWYLCLCCRGRWDLSRGYAALTQSIQDQGLKTVGGMYACDLAGFLLNGVEENAVSMLSIQLDEEEGRG